MRTKIHPELLIRFDRLYIACFLCVLQNHIYIFNQFCFFLPPQKPGNWKSEELRQWMMVKRKERLAEFREQRETHLKSEKRPFKPGGTKLQPFRPERQKRCVQQIVSTFIYTYYIQLCHCSIVSTYMYVRTRTLTLK